MEEKKWWQSLWGVMGGETVTDGGSSTTVVKKPNYLVYIVATLTLGGVIAIAYANSAKK